MLVPFFGLVIGGSDTPSAGPLLHVILLLEDILPLLPLTEFDLIHLSLTTILNKDFDCTTYVNWANFVFGP